MTHAIDRHPSEGQLRQLLVEAAVRAPSGDNCQPWHFRFEGSDHIHVHFLPERAKNFFDFRNRGTFLSVGAVVENMRVQAAGTGMGMRVFYPGGEGRDEPAASIVLEGEPDFEVSESRIHAMRERTVNRRPFIPRRIPRERMEKVLRNPVDGTSVQVFDGRKEINRWARIIYQAELIRFSHPTIHEELFSKIMFSRAEAEDKRIGLEIDRLGIGPSARPMLKFLKPWERMQRLSRWGVDRALAGHSRMLAMSSGAMVLVRIKDNSPRSWMLAGEQVERLWNNAMEAGLQVHPMTVSLYLDQRFQEDGMQDFQPNHESLLRNNRRMLGDILGEDIGAMIFRLGYGFPMRTRAIRLPLDAFVDDRL